MDDITIVDQALVIGAIVSQTACLLCCLINGAGRVLPLFSCYLAYAAIADILGSVICRYGSLQTYWYAYTGSSVTGYVFEFVVMWELASRLTRSLRPDVELIARRMATLFLVAFITMATIMACLVSYRGAEFFVGASLHCDLAFGIFSVLAFLALLALVQVRGIGWNDRHAQVTACLSLCAVFSLLAEIAHEYAAASTLYQYRGFAMIERSRCCACCITMFFLSWRMFTYRDRDASHVRGVENVTHYDMKAF